MMNIREFICKKLQEGFKTKWDLYRLLISQILIILSLVIYKSISMVLFIVVVYAITEYLIDKKDKHEGGNKNV